MVKSGQTWDLDVFDIVVLVLEADCRICSILVLWAREGNAFRWRAGVEYPLGSSAFEQQSSSLLSEGVEIS